MARFRRRISVGVELKTLKGMMIGIALAAMSLIYENQPPIIEASPATRNQILKNGYEITIRVPVDVLGLQGKRVRIRESGEKVNAKDYWENGAEKIWNDGLEGFKYRGCYTIEVDLEINALRETDDTQSGHHWVWLERAGFRSKVFHGGGKNEDSSLPFRESRWGQWGRISPETVAHESGHFLGLGDDYVDKRDENGKFIGAEELPGREGTMMANYRSNPEGRVDQELVDRLGDLLSEFVDLPPCIAGFWESSQTKEEDGNDITTTTVDFFISVQPEDSGELHGSAVGEFSLNGTVTEGRCSFEYHAFADIELELKAQGESDGPYTIEALQDQKVYEVQRHQLCDQAIQLTIDWDVGLVIEDVVFEDGKWIYEDEEDKIVLAYVDPEDLE